MVEIPLNKQNIASINFNTMNPIYTRIINTKIITMCNAENINVNSVPNIATLIRIPNLNINKHNAL